MGSRFWQHMFDRMPAVSPSHHRSHMYLICYRSICARWMYSSDKKVFSWGNRWRPGII